MESAHADRSLVLPSAEGVPAPDAPTTFTEAPEGEKKMSKVKDDIAKLCLRGFFL